MLIILIVELLICLLCSSKRAVVDDVKEENILASVA